MGVPKAIGHVLVGQQGYFLLNDGGGEVERLSWQRRHGLPDSDLQGGDAGHRADGHVGQAVGGHGPLHNVMQDINQIHCLPSQFLYFKVHRVDIVFKCVGDLLQQHKLVEADIPQAGHVHKQHLSGPDAQQPQGGHF